MRDEQWNLLFIAMLWPVGIFFKKWRDKFRRPL